MLLAGALLFAAGAGASQAKPSTQKQARSSLKVKVQGLPQALPPAKTRKFKVRISNAGAQSTGKVKVSLRGSRGLVVRPGSRTLQRLKPGQTATLNASVRAKRGAKGAARLLVNATSRPGGTVRAARTLRVRRPGSGAKPKPGSGRIDSPAGHYFWAFEDIRVDRSSDPIGFYFANDRFVHVGLPEGGLPVCNRAKVKRDSDGNIESGCTRYTFNARTKVIRIGKLTGKFTAKQGRSSVTFDGKSYMLATIPKAGTRLRATLINRGFSGMCGLILGCRTWKENLALDRKGRFIRSSSTITSMGGAGTPFVWGANFPPDEYGTYRVLGKGRIQFRYQDGKISNETIAVIHDERGRPDATGEGLILDQTWFYVEDD